MSDPSRRCGSCREEMRVGTSYAYCVKVGCPLWCVSIDTVKTHTEQPQPRQAPAADPPPPQERPTVKWTPFQGYLFSCSCGLELYIPDRMAGSAAQRKALEKFHRIVHEFAPPQQNGQVH